MMILEIKRKPVIVSFTFIVILFIQNLLIFQNHYFHRAGFPWDFDKAYFAMPAFWIKRITMKVRLTITGFRLISRIIIGYRIIG